jgi:transcriptional regulator with XRE-family HTH domain
MYKRIKKLRKINNLKIEEISKLLNISSKLYIEYENGTVEIPIIIFSKLAKIYNTSIDFIVEETDEISPNKKST